MIEDFEQIHQSIIQKEQSISQLNECMMELFKENNQINNEINLCIQKINKTQSYVNEMNENKFRFLYDELPKMIDEMNRIEIDEKNVWNRLQKLCDNGYNDNNMRYPYISICTGVLCGLLFCFL